MSLKNRIERLETLTGVTETVVDFKPWQDWWDSAINEFPPEFPPEMPTCIREHFFTLVMMDLYTAARPLDEIPEHIRTLLPADFV